MTHSLSPTRSILGRCSRLSTAMINDVLRSHGLIDQSLPHPIRPLRDDVRVAGHAFTIAGAKDRSVADDMPQRAEMLEAIGAESVCVWATDSDDESAQWGEVMTMAAQQRGCLGAVIDGGIRDTEMIDRLEFPVFHRYHSSNGMLGRFRITGWQHDIVIGAVTITPGDLVVGDRDGVVIVPQSMAAQVIGEAETIFRNEIEIKKMVVDGLSPSDVIARGGYF